MWPMKRAEKKPPIMTKVQKVRVRKLAFFFSYSACCSTGDNGFCLWSAVGRSLPATCWTQTHLDNVAQRLSRLCRRRLFAHVAEAGPPCLCRLAVLVAKLDPSPTASHHGGCMHAWRGALSGCDSALPVLRCDRGSPNFQVGSRTGQFSCRRSRAEQGRWNDATQHLKSVPTPACRAEPDCCS
jgi:hypothetical protein